MADPRIYMAYDAATRELGTQSVELAATKNRALGTLGIAALLTVLAATVGRLKIQTSAQGPIVQQGPILPTWAVWTLLGILVCSGGLTLIALFNSRDWRYGMPAKEIMECQALGVNEDEVLTRIVNGMRDSSSFNNRILATRLFLLYSLITLTLIQVIILLIALVRPQ